MSKYSKEVSKDAYKSTKFFLIINWKKLMISIGIFIFIGVVAFFFLKEKSWFIEHFKEGYIYGFCFLIGFPLVWTYYFLYGSPKHLWEKSQQEIDELKKQIQLQEDKNTLINNLKIELEEYDNAGNIQHGYEPETKEKKWQEILQKFPKYKDFLTRKKKDHLYIHLDSFKVNYNRLCDLILYLEAGIDPQKQVIFSEQY